MQKAGAFQKLRLFLCGFSDQGADVVRKHLYGGAVLAAVGHNDVRIALAGLYKGLVHRFDRGKVLVDHAV